MKSKSILWKVTKTFLQLIQFGTPIIVYTEWANIGIVVHMNLFHATGRRGWWWLLLLLLLTRRAYSLLQCPQYIWPTNLLLFLFWWNWIRWFHIRMNTQSMMLRRYFFPVPPPSSCSYWDDNVGTPTPHLFLFFSFQILFIYLQDQISLFIHFSTFFA